MKVRKFKTVRKFKGKKKEEKKATQVPLVLNIDDEKGRKKQRSTAEAATEEGGGAPEAETTNGESADAAAQSKTGWQYSVRRYVFSNSELERILSDF